MDQYTTHTQMRSVDEISDTTIRETITGKEKTEYDNDIVETSTKLKDFLDGGLKAWLTIGETMCRAFATAWIGSVQYAVIFMPGIIVGHLFDIGYFRILFILVSILLVLSMFLIAVFPIVAHRLIKILDFRGRCEWLPSSSSSSLAWASPLFNETLHPPCKRIKKDPEPESVDKCTVYTLVSFYFYCLSGDVHRHFGNILGPMAIITGAVTYVRLFARTLASMIVVAVI
ncbi:hypothetical protein IW262DRAFT_1292214 [Armillaria fumosa]|nr:hypothetical protein IW262DRAFT_1292214 [Armillaria fumosa]